MMKVDTDILHLKVFKSIQKYSKVFEKVFDKNVVKKYSKVFKSIYKYTILIYFL
jgi:hypothetical protein